MRGDGSVWLAGIALVAVVAAGCSSEEPSTPAAPAPPTAASESASPQPTATPDPFAIPDNPADIDEAYVERVLEALDQGVVEAVQELAEARAVTPDVRQALSTTYLRKARAGYLRAFREALRASRFPFRSSPRAMDVVSVDRIISATSTCLFTVITQDSSGLGTERVEPFQVYYHLEAKEPPVPSVGNPTPWMVAADAEARTDVEYEDPCARS